ncbi:MAG: hypothetical protein AB7G37_00945 [Solirubrobacteraceae bacterium]
MTGQPTRVIVDLDDPDEHELPAEPAATPPPSPPSGGSSSLLDEIRAEAQELAGDDDKVLPLGKFHRLMVRYRALPDHEREDLQRKAAARAKTRAKVSRDRKRVDLDAETEQAALLLVNACVELLAVNDDGDLVPLHEHLATEMGDQAPAGPMRYDRETAGLLLPDLADKLGRPPSAVDVAKALHIWAGGYQPLRTNANLLGLWSSAVNAEALDEALEGN